MGDSQDSLTRPENIMKVKLTYFKSSGKYYSDGEYETSIPHIELLHGGAKAPPLFQIWDEVAGMMVRGQLPDLIPGHSNFSVLVDVPDHPHRHPRMIFGGGPDAE